MSVLNSYVGFRSFSMESSGNETENRFSISTKFTLRTIAHNILSDDILSLVDKNYINLSKTIKKRYFCSRYFSI